MICSSVNRFFMCPSYHDLPPENLYQLELEFSVILAGLEEKDSMKASKFLDAQKAFVLKQAEDGVPVAEVGRIAGIS